MKMPSRKILVSYLKGVKNLVTIRRTWYLFFALIIAFAMLTILVDAYIFYFYGLSWQKNIPDPQIEVTRIQEDLLDQAVFRLKERALRFAEVEEKDIIVGDPF